MSERQLNHIVAIVTKEQQTEITERFWRAGFPTGDLVQEYGLGVTARLLPLGGGGFLELSARSSYHNSAADAVFAQTPRVTACCYTTMDAGAELERWRAAGNTDAMAGAGSWYREDGSPGYYVGVMPVQSLTGTFGLQDRRLFPMPYADLADTAPKVTRIHGVGKDATLWRQRHEQYFGLTGRVGDTELVFTEAENDGIHISVTFEVPKEGGTIPLADGSFELVEG